MGRYSSVQAYSDTNKNVRAVSYEQATGSNDVKKGAGKFSSNSLQTSTVHCIFAIPVRSCFLPLLCVMNLTVDYMKPFSSQCS
jgi:hypothetical protein